MSSVPLAGTGKANFFYSKGKQVSGKNKFEQKIPANCCPYNGVEKSDGLLKERLPHKSFEAEHHNPFT